MSRVYALDEGVQRHGTVVIGGSPLRLFRLTVAGVAVIDRIEAGEPVDESRLVGSLLAAGAIHPRFSSGPFTPSDVTVVTPTLGPPRHLIDGAILVDDGSVPPVVGATARLTDNRGPASARNHGLADVTTPLVAFVDADVEVDPDWLDALLPHFADDAVALVAPRVRSAPGPSMLERYEADQNPLDLGATPALVRPGSRVAYVPAAAIVCRADAVRSIGGFDTDLRFGEDVDLVWRLAEQGWTCRYEPAVQVRHAPRPTWHEWFVQRIGYGSSAAPLATRHPGALTPLRTNGWSLSTWILGALGRPALAAALGAGSAAALVRRLPDLPARAAFRLGAEGNVRAGEQIAAAVRRAWWPVVAVAALRSRVARRVLAASALAARSPLRAIDDGAYALGVWRGVFVDHNVEPLIPTISAWPPRTRTTEGSTNRYRRTT